MRKGICRVGMPVRKKGGRMEWEFGVGWLVFCGYGRRWQFRRRGGDVRGCFDAALLSFFLRDLRRAERVFRQAGCIVSSFKPVVAVLLSSDDNNRSYLITPVHMLMVESRQKHTPFLAAFSGRRETGVSVLSRHRLPHHEPQIVPPQLSLQRPCSDRHSHWQRQRADLRLTRRSSRRPWHPLWKA